MTLPMSGASAVADFDDDGPPEGFRSLQIPEDVIVPFDDARRRRGRAEESDATSQPIIALPYVWTDPENIPLRDWLYGRLLVRRSRRPASQAAPPMQRGPTDCPHPARNGSN
jgi:hypothetical protein